MISSQTASSTTSRSGRRKIAIQILAIAVGAMTAVTSAWAVFVRQDGNTLRAQNEKYQPLANQTATISLGGVTKTVTTRDDGTFCIKTEQNATEEERSAPYCAIFPGGGSGTITIGGYSAPFSLGPSGALSISTWQKLSNTEIGGIAAAAALGVYALTKDNNDNNASSTGGGSSGGTTNTQPSTPPSTGGNLNNCFGAWSFQFMTSGSNAGTDLFGGQNISCTVDQMHVACAGMPVFQGMVTSSGDFNSQATGPYGPVASTIYRLMTRFMPTANSCNASGTLETGPLVYPDEFGRWNLLGTRIQF